MPTTAIFDGRLIRVPYLYKHGIPANGPLTCHCGEKVILRQSRDGDKEYTEHFSHINNVKGTHKTCEYKEKPMSEWHRKMLEMNRHDTRETKREKHFVDAYDASCKRGIEFQNSSISPQDINSRDSATELDWVFNTTGQYCCVWDEIALCEIPSNNWEKAVPACKNNVILDTGKKEWILLKDRRSFYVEIDNKKRHMWIGKPITLDEVVEITCLKNTLTEAGKKYLQHSDSIEVVPIIHARCKAAMKYLDPLIRQYALDIDYERNTVYAIESVAGSGKTTTLLKLAEVNSDKKILYLAFNAAIVKEIKRKKPKNLSPYTFDALIRARYIDKYPDDGFKVQDLTPHTFGQTYKWSQNKPYKMKQDLIAKYNKFCKDVRHPKMFDFMMSKFPTSKRTQLITMWQRTRQRKLLTFAGLRKLAFVQRWFKDYIDSHYDMVFIDEAQDFDPVMLKILINDTTVPKIFVGDPRQAIYKWRGAVNAFKKLPEDAFRMEFYTTWRIGNPACDQIREAFKECWMVAGNDHPTIFHKNEEPAGRYDYLFRTWRHLLQTASKTSNIWINGFESKKPVIQRLHKSLHKYDMSEEDKAQFEDDLPNFLLEMDADELKNILSEIEARLVPKEEADCRMYTIHAYKGMEANQIRIFNDIDHKTEANVYYVALTRGKQNIYLNDPPEEEDDAENEGEEIKCEECGIQTIPEWWFSCKGHYRCTCCDMKRIRSNKGFILSIGTLKNSRLGLTRS